VDRVGLAPRVHKVAQEAPVGLEHRADREDLVVRVVLLPAEAAG